MNRSTRSKSRRWGSSRKEEEQEQADNGKNVANPIDKEEIFGNAEQIQLKNMRVSAVELGAGGEELHCTGELIGQLDLQGIAD